MWPGSGMGELLGNKSGCLQLPGPGWRLGELSRIDTGGLRPALTFTTYPGPEDSRRFSCCVWLRVLWGLSPV